MSIIIPGSEHVVPAAAAGEKMKKTGLAESC